MKISKKKKSVLIALSVLLCIITGIVVLHYIETLHDLLKPPADADFVDTSGKVVVQQFGQPIFLHYNTSNIKGPLKTYVNIFFSEKEPPAVGYTSEGNFVMPEIKLIYQKDGLECYEWSDQYNCFITYKHGDSEVKVYPNDLEKTEDELLYPVAKQEFMTHDFRRIELFGELLVKQNDSEAKEMLKKYAANSFTTAEINQNEKSNKISASRIQGFAEKLTRKYDF